MKDQLDQAIDVVAAHLTNVHEDQHFATRVIQSLPDRRGGLAWILSGWAPRLAVLAMIVTAGVLWNRPVPRIELAPLASTMPAAMSMLHASVEAELNRTMPLERLEPMEPLEPRPDHEFSLAALDPVAPLEDEALTVAPLEVADLSLTNDFPR